MPSTRGLRGARGGAAAGSIALTGLLCLLATSALPQAPESARVVDVRTGRHATFDRIVFELDRQVQVRWREGGDEPSRLTISARAPFDQRVFGSRRLGNISVLSGEGETTLLLGAPKGPTRVFTLDGPARVVIDIADPGVGRFDAPRGSVAVDPLPSDELATRPPIARDSPPAPPKVAVPEAAVPEPSAPPEAPRPKPAAPPVPEAAPPKPTAPPVPEAAPPKPTASPVPEAAAPKPSASPVPEAAVPEAPAPAPPVSAPEPGPSSVVQPALPETPQATLPTPPAALPPAAAPRLPEAPARNVWTWLFLALLLGAGLWFAAVMWRGWRTRGAKEFGRPHGDGDEASSPHVITQAELAGGPQRVDILEQRLAEEQRSRRQLEQRVAELSEEHKVLRDRLARITRRSEA